MEWRKRRRQVVSMFPGYKLHQFLLRSHMLDWPIIPTPTTPYCCLYHCSILFSREQLPALLQALRLLSQPKQSKHQSFPFKAQQSQPSMLEWQGCGLALLPQYQPALSSSGPGLRGLSCPWSLQEPYHIGNRETVSCMGVVWKWAQSSFLLWTSLTQGL